MFVTRVASIDCSVSPNFLKSKNPILNQTLAVPRLIKTH